MESIESYIDYTCIDPDPNCIEKGKQLFPKLNFIEGFFPKDMPKFKKYDLIIMMALFPQIPNWKEMLLDLVRFSNRFVNISCTLKLSGTTVVDKDVSYVYYLDSGERVHQVIHNIYEITNFCCIKEMRVKKIYFYGYHVPKAGDNFRSVPNKEQIRGNLFLELFDENANPIRMGGKSEIRGKDLNYHPFRPEINIIIDGKNFDLS